MELSQTPQICYNSTEEKPLENHHLRPEPRQVQTIMELLKKNSNSTDLIVEASEELPTLMVIYKLILSYDEHLGVLLTRMWKKMIKKNIK